jgi:hypothetical protein
LSCSRILEVELAQQILKSELLVSEDEDFLNNFILSEEVLEKYQVLPPFSSEYNIFMYSFYRFVIINEAHKAASSFLIT